MLFKHFLLAVFFYVVADVSAIQLLVPFFGNPDAESVQRIAKSSDSLSVVTVLKPSNGTLDDSLKAAITDLSKAGVLIFGYTTSLYAAKDLTQVLADVDRYNLWDSEYRPQGIFIDQASSDVNQYSYYNELYLSLRKKFGCKTKVVTNVASSVDASFFGGEDEKTRTADTIVLFEDDYNAFMTHTFDDYISQKADSELCAIVHSCPKEHLQEVVDRAISANIGFIYVTDKHMNNPYDALPTYFEDLVAYMATK